MHEGAEAAAAQISTSEHHHCEWSVTKVARVCLLALLFRYGAVSLIEPCFFCRRRFLILGQKCSLVLVCAQKRYCFDLGQEVVTIFD